jgi:hypothetical protein
MEGDHMGILGAVVFFVVALPFFFFLKKVCVHTLISTNKCLQTAGLQFEA